jgi:glycosyltransferase involved in cell wall biosynthesis
VKRVLALAVHPAKAPATRFRILAFREALANAGMELTLATSLDDRAFEMLYTVGKLLPKARRAVASLVHQWIAAIARGPWDAVWIQREAALVGPPALEYVLGRRLPLIFDLDDAVWLSTADASRNPWAARLLKFPSKTRWLMRRSAHVIAGSEYLATEARRHNDRVSVVPTVVSRERWTPRDERANEVPVVGWIGTHGTSVYLRQVAPALQRLRAEGRRFRLRFIGADQSFVFPVDYERVPWSLEREIDLFKGLDIGLAPVADDAWGRGKCAFKQVQYFAAGVPCVSSPVGPAADFVAQGAALGASDDEGWYRAVSRLLEDTELRRRTAATARALVERELCVEVQGARIARILEGVAAGSGYAPRPDADSAAASRPG